MQLTSIKKVENEGNNNGDVMTAKACPRGTKRVGNKCMQATKKINLTLEEQSYVIEAVQTISNIQGVDKTKLLNKLGIKSWLG